MSSTINDAIESICDDICGRFDASDNKTRAEAIALLTACKILTPDTEPAQEPEITWQQAVKVLHDICRANSEGVLDCPDDCPIKSWCDQAIPPEGKRPEMWELPDD